MSTAKKLKTLWKAGAAEDKSKVDNAKDKAEIEAYINKIRKLLKDDPANAKKAAMVIQQMIHETKKK